LPGFFQPDRHVSERTVGPIITFLESFLDMPQNRFGKASMRFNLDCTPPVLCVISDGWNRLRQSGCIDEKTRLIISIRFIFLAAAAGN
jgi:hypothetical protein